MKAVIIHRLIVPLTLAVLVARVDHAQAQGGFPAPLPGQASQSSPFPPVNGAAPASPFPSNGATPFAGGAAGGGFAPSPGAAPPSGGPSDACMKGFIPLREDAEKRGKMIRT